MKALVEHIAKALVNDPDKVTVTERYKGDVLLLELRVGPGDMGRVIGRGGKIINAMRAVVYAAAAHTDQRVELDVLD